MKQILGAIHNRNAEGGPVGVVIACNKCEENTKVITPLDVICTASALNCPVIYISAKLGINLKALWDSCVFQTAKACATKRNKQYPQVAVLFPPPPPPPDPPKPSSNQSHKRCCIS